MKTFQDFVAEMSYQPVSKEKESRIKKQMTAAKKSSKDASKTGDFEAAARHDERSRAMKDKVKRSDLPY
jgi:protein-arginine kinase activator protein McsA